MCDPMTIIGIGMSVAGSAVNANQQARAASMNQQAQNNAMALSMAARRAELERQKAFEQEQIALFDRSAQQMTPETREGNQERGRQEFMQQYDTSRGGPPEGQFLSGQSEASPETRQNVAATISQGATEARKRVDALARLSGYGTAEQQSSQSITGTNSRMGSIGGLRRGSLGVSQFEQAVPNSPVQPGSSALGDIMTGAGGMLARGGGRAAGQAGGGFNMPNLFGTNVASTPIPTPGGGGLMIPNSLY